MNEAYSGQYTHKRADKLASCGQNGKMNGVSRIDLEKFFAGSASEIGVVNQAGRIKKAWH
ncbi:hypothetical protein KIY57_09885 [Heyndrickxia coagulans]|nr:hypothetical protein KIY57_09885 [Heyndrickxia coagulans]